MADAPLSLLRAAARTDRGRVRPRNEDAFLCEPEAGLFAVADGIGGLNGGDVASRAAVDFLKAALSSPPLELQGRIQRCREALNGASAWIRQYAAREGYPGMGATVAMLLFDPSISGEAAAVHAGDSRVYRLRDGILEQLTRDHSAASIAGLLPDQAIPSIYQGVITRAVGIRRTVEVDLTPVSVRDQDLFLLCTDGLYNSLPRDRLVRILREPLDPEVLAGRLLEEALNEGGEDNITFIVVRYGSPPSLSAVEPPSRGPSYWRRRGFLWFLLPAVVVGVIGVHFARKNKMAVSSGVIVSFPVASGGQADRVESGLEREEGTARTSVGPEEGVGGLGIPEEGEAQNHRFWQEERLVVESDGEAVKRRYTMIRSAYLWLERWSGEPLRVPSLMLVGRPEQRGEGWIEYLREAQRRWLERARAALARQTEECETLRPERVRFLYHWIWDGRGEGDLQTWDRYTRAWENWARELEGVREGLSSCSEEWPFLTRWDGLAWREKLQSGRSGGLEVWDQFWPWMDQVWRRYEYWLTKLGPEKRSMLDRMTGEANAIWGEYATRGISVGAWRGLAPLERIRFFLEQLGTMLPGEAVEGTGLGLGVRVRE